MNKILKTLLYTVLAIAVFLLAVILILPLVIDPNDYKDEIVQTVHDRTGRTLTLDGDLGLSVFPWLGLELGKTTLGNAPGFGDTPMAQIDQAAVKVKLLPLLRQKVEIDTIVLDGLQLELARDKQGRFNWDDLVAAAGAKDKQPPTEAKKPAAPLAALSIGGLDVRKARLHWADAMSGGDYLVENLSLKTSRLVLAQPMDIELGFDLTSGKPVIQTPVTLSSRVTVNPSAETLRVENLRLKLLDATLEGEADGSTILSQPDIEASLRLKPANLRTVLVKTGLQADLPKGALEKVALELKAHYQDKANQLAISDLKLSLDNSHLTGKATVGLGTINPIRFTLKIDDMDLDRYLPPTDTKAPVPPTAAAAAAPLAIPIEPLRTLDLKGTMTIGKLKAIGIRSDNIHLPVTAAKGQITLGPSKAGLYGGHYTGTEVLDVRKGAPKLTMTEKLNNVEVGGLLKDADIYDKFTGKGDVQATLTARGLAADDILNTLSGTARAKLKNGKIIGLNLYKTVTDADDQLKKATGKPVPKRPDPGPDTEYADLTATAKITNGVVTNDDLVMNAPYIKVRGAGKVELPTSRLHYRTLVDIAGNESSTPIPVEFYGTFDKINIKVDIEKLLRDAAQKELNKRTAEEKKKAEEQLKKQLGKELQKLLGR